ncbi:MAG: O-antigen ligase family protein [Gammaproteobacteria bacterium]|nr:O-antigen ligase family protein [Gammaproteobacteria bacterium]
MGAEAIRPQPAVLAGGTQWLLLAARTLYCLGCLTLPLLVVRASGITASDALFAMALLMAAAAVVGRGQLPKLHGLGVIVVAGAGYTVAALLSSLTLPADALIGSAFAAVKFFYLTAVWFALGIFVLPSFTHTVSAVSFWTLGCALSGLGGLAQTVIDPTVIPLTESIVGRAVGFTGHPNDLGASLGIALAPALALATGTALSRFRRLLTGACLTLVVTGLILSASASGIISAVAAVATWIVLTGRTRLGLILAGIGAAVLVAVGVLLETASVELSAVADLYALSEGGKGGTFAERIDTFVAAWEEISAQPLLGVGTVAGGRLTRVGLATHNVLLGAWFETGVLGMLSLLLILLAAFWISRRALQLAVDREVRNLVAALVGAEVAFSIYSMTAPGLYQRYGWISVALIFAMYNSLRLHYVTHSRWNNA